MSHLDYSDIVYDKPKSDSFTSKLERVQRKRSQQYQVPFRVHLVNALTRNSVWNPTVIENGFVNLRISIK